MNRFVQMYELDARYDARQSFYGKAHVVVYDDRVILRSYSTDVAMIKDGKIYLNGYYSQTTNRHIKEFARQNGFPYDRKYLDERIDETKKEDITF